MKSTALLPFLKKVTCFKRKGKILTDEKIKRVEKLFFEGYTRSQIAQELNIGYDVIRKAVSDGRIKCDKKESSTEKLTPLTKSDRNQNDEDCADQLGVGCTRTGERIAAAVGALHLAESRFEKQESVANAGVLFALPALFSNGLFFQLKEIFTEFTGYYSITHILSLLAFMALCRIKTVERLRFHSPGELGTLLGLDRIPEVKCLREKLTAMSEDNEAQKWG